MTRLRIKKDYIIINDHQFDLLDGKFYYSEDHVFALTQSGSDVLKMVGKIQTFIRENGEYYNSSSFKRLFKIFQNYSVEFVVVSCFTVKLRGEYYFLVMAPIAYEDEEEEEE